MKISKRSLPVGYNIIVARNKREIEAIRDSWEKLQVHPNADIDYYLMLNDALPEIVRPHITALYFDGEIKSLLIGRIENRQLDFKMGYLSILKPKVRLLTIVYGGWLGDMSISNCRLLISAMLDVLRQGEADIVFFNHLDVQSDLFQAAVTLPNIISRDYFPIISLHWKASLSGSYENFCNARSKNTRHNLRRYSKMLSDKYANRIKYICFRDASEFEKIMCDTESVASKTYHRALGAGFIDNVVSRERIRLALKRKQFRAYMAYIDDIPCAFWNGFVHNDTLYTDTTGYNPIYEKYHIGTWLLIKIIQDLCDEQIAFIDFGFGDAFYKQNFCDLNSQESPAYIYAPSFKGALLNAT